MGQIEFFINLCMTCLILKSPVKMVHYHTPHQTIMQWVHTSCQHIHVPISSHYYNFTRVLSGHYCIITSVFSTHLLDQAHLWLFIADKYVHRQIVMVWVCGVVFPVFILKFCPLVSCFDFHFLPLSFSCHFSSAPVFQLLISPHYLNLCFSATLY